MVLLLSIVIGAMVGWAMGEFMPNSLFGVAGHIIIGIIGALVGGYFFEMVNMPAIGALMTALVGATSLVFVGRVAQFDTP